MNILIVYDSQYGNTEQVAHAIGEAARFAGPVRFLRVEPDIPVPIGEADLLIIGSPTQGWQPTPAMRALLATLGPEMPPDLAVVCFDTRFKKPRWLTGSAARSIERTFRALGIAPVVPPESFFVGGREGPLLEGELDRAAGWAWALLAKVEAPQLSAH